MKKFWLVLTLILNITLLHAQMSQVTDALSKNDAEALSNHFVSVVELNIDGTEGNYAKAQAKIMVRDFFNKIKPASFTLKHKSESSSSKYIIGDLSSKGQKWRVTVYFRKEGNTDAIHSLKFEKE